MKNGLIFIGVSFELLGVVFGGLYFGEKLDVHFGTQGVFVPVVLIACMFAWNVHFVVLIKRFMKEMEKDDNSSVK